MGTTEVQCGNGNMFKLKFQICNKFTKHLYAISQLCSMGSNSVFFGLAPAYDAYIIIETSDY